MDNFKLVLALSLISMFIISSCTKEQIENRPPLVNVGNDTTINLTNYASDTIKLNGEATDKDGSVVSFLWSQVSGPTTTTFVSPGSKSSFVTGVTSGTYVFQLMATDDKGATGVKSLSVTVIAPKIYNLTLQPYQNPTEVHIWGNGNGLEGSMSTGFYELGAAAWTYNGLVVEQRGLVKFDLSTIPAAATVISAKLSLYSNPTPLNGDLTNANSGFNNTTLIQRVVTSWNPSSVKWNNQPSVTSQNKVTIPHTTLPFLDLVDIDVTNLVQSMVTANANYGFLIRLENEVIYNSRLFCSSYNSIASKRPKLMIQYSK